jgi:hypothetical protein
VRGNGPEKQLPERRRRNASSAEVSREQVPERKV